MHTPFGKRSGTAESMFGGCRRVARVFLLCIVIAAGVLPAGSGADAHAAGTEYALQWMEMGLGQRQRAAEAIGEESARLFAEANGFTPLYDRHGIGDIPQGLDQVYMGPDGRYKVLEAKGGTASVRQSYGYRQGSPEWAVKSSEYVVNSKRASAAQKAVHEQVLRAAAEGKLDILTVGTPHTLGKPGTPVLKNAVSTNDAAAVMAARALKNLPPAAKAAKIAAGRVAKTAASVLSGAAKLLPYAATAYEIYDFGEQTYTVESDYAQGKIGDEARLRSHTVNGARKATGLAGMWAGMKIGGAAGGAAGALAAGVGAPIGASVGALAGGIAGYFGGEYAADELLGWLW